MKNKKDLINEIEKIVNENNMELVDVNAKFGSNPLLEIIIYKKEGITLDDCSYISRKVDTKLDLDEFFTGSYNIEVASPGLDRNLKTNDDFRRNLNNKVELNLYSKVMNSKEYVGELVDYTDGTIKIKTDSEVIEIERKNIAKMRQYIDFGR